MSPTVLAYLIYLVGMLPIILIVGHALHRHGRLFLLDLFPQNAAIADRVNDLLLVGYYLVNVAVLLILMQACQSLTTYTAAIEFTITRAGLVTIFLGALHIVDVLTLMKIARRGRSV